MIFVLHGDDQPSLREGFLRLKRDYAEGKFWDRPLSELASYLREPSLFREKEIVAVEDPELKELTKEIVGAWAKGGKDVAILFSRRLTPIELNRFEGTRVLGFAPKIPKNVFPFLDALVAREKAKALTEAHRLLREGNDFDYLLNMITWQLRNLARVKSGSVKGMKEFTIDKLRRAASKWSEADLRSAFSDLLRDDLRRKKGKKVPLYFLINQLTG